MTYRPTPQLLRVAEGDVSLLAVRLARWTPMKLLLRFLASKGGEVSLDEVEERLGGRMLEVTKRYPPGVEAGGVAEARQEALQ